MKKLLASVVLASLCVAPLGSCDADGGVPPTVTLHGHVGDFLPAQGLVPLAGVEVCVFERPEIPCAMTDAEGRYALSDLPAGSDLLISYEREGSVSQLGMLSTEGQDVGPVDIRLAQDGAAEIFFQIIGATWPLGETGGITFGAYPAATGGGLTADAGLPGFEVALTPASGTGPVFVADNEIPDPALSVTAQPGWGLYANVSPGLVRVSVARAGFACPKVRPGYGWSSSMNGDGTIDVPVVAGFLTAIGVLCEEAPAASP